MESQLPTAAANAAVVERFYAAVAARDGDAIAAVVDDHFAEDVAFEWPPSLPYGGRVDGAHQLRKMFTAMAGSPAKVGPDGLSVTSLTASDDQVAAEVSFAWYPPGKDQFVQSGAFELWTFEGAEVRSVRAFYWDTAALVAAMA
jgi:ketosteroid isomerase-like protein